MSGNSLPLDLQHPLLRDHSGAGVEVAILDSGVNARHPHVGGVVRKVGVDDTGALHGDALDRLGHGTAVTAAVHEKAPGARLHVVKVFHDTLSTTIVGLVDALNHALDSGVRIINLSLGTVREEHAPLLEEVVASARERGVLVVSARSRDGRLWYPGSLEGVVGVELDRESPRDRITLEWDGVAVRARASGYPRPIPGVHPDRNLNGVSFAVANTTGLLARLLEAQPGIRAVEELRSLIPLGSAPNPAPGA